MSEHTANVTWLRQADEEFTNQKYSRGHRWIFDGGAEVAASSSPNVVPLPYSVEANVDPEEAFIASLSSCHMLFFLSIAARKKWIVESYNDHATGTMAKNQQGAVAMTHVILWPKVVFAHTLNVSRAQIEKVHHLAHQQCFIANSVRTEITVEVPP